MNDRDRETIAAARATIRRVDATLTEERGTREREPHAATINRLDAWREGVKAQERQFAEARAKRQKAEDDERNNTNEWSRWINDTIAASVLHCARTLAEALRDEIATLRDELTTRDKRIDRLERLLSQQAVTTARLEVRVLEGEAARDQSRVLDLPNPLRKGLN